MRAAPYEGKGKGVDGFLCVVQKQGRVVGRGKGLGIVKRIVYYRVEILI